MSAGSREFNINEPVCHDRVWGKSSGDENQGAGAGLKWWWRILSRRTWLEHLHNACAWVRSHLWHCDVQSYWARGSLKLQCFPSGQDVLVDLLHFHFHCHFHRLCLGIFFGVIIIASWDQCFNTGTKPLLILYLPTCRNFFCIFN